MLIAVVVPWHQLRTHSFYYWKFNWSTFLMQYCNLGEAKCWLWLCDCLISVDFILSRFVLPVLISSSLQCSALFCYSHFHRLCCGTLFPFPYLSFCNQRLWWARKRVGRNSNCLVFFLNCLSTLIDCQSELPLSSSPSISLNWFPISLPQFLFASHLQSHSLFYPQLDWVRSCLGGGGATIELQLVSTARLEFIGLPVYDLPLFLSFFHPPSIWWSFSIKPCLFFSLFHKFRCHIHYASLWLEWYSWTCLDDDDRPAPKNIGQNWTEWPLR